MELLQALSAKLSSLRFQRGVAGGQRTSSGLERVREGQLIDLGDRHEKEVDRAEFRPKRKNAQFLNYEKTVVPTRTRAMLQHVAHDPKPYAVC